jgi:hypothetical protein
LEKVDSCNEASVSDNKSHIIDKSKENNLFKSTYSRREGTSAEKQAKSDYCGLQNSAQKRSTPFGVVGALYR